jgi:hypothetical protein
VPPGGDGDCRDRAFPLGQRVVARSETLAKPIGGMDQRQGYGSRPCRAGAAGRTGRLPGSCRLLPARRSIGAGRTLVDHRVPDRHSIADLVHGGAPAAGDLGTAVAALAVAVQSGPCVAGYGGGTTAPST